MVDSCKKTKAHTVFQVLLILSLLTVGCSTTGAQGASVPDKAISETETSDDTDSGDVASDDTDPGDTDSDDTDPGDTDSEDIGSEETDNMTNTEEQTMRMTIGGTEVEVLWEENVSVDALCALVQDKPLSIEMSMYGGFEQVGSIGSSLPRNDAQITTTAGDIVLYSGNQIVVFYGSNTWAYTRLGRITNLNEEELADMLGNGDATLTFDMK